MTHLLRTYERGILRVTINRPAKRNALSREVLRELKGVFLAHAEREDLLLAVLGGAGELAFSAGGDFGDLGEVRTEEDVERFADEATAALDAIRFFPVPTLAAVNGLCLGGGAELALACDMRVAASHARIGFTHATLNLGTAWGGGPDLFRLVGPARAVELLASAGTLAAAEALAAGLVNAVAPGAEPFIDFVDRFIAPMAERPGHVLRAIKSQAAAQRGGTGEALLRAAERHAFAATWTHAAHWNAVERWLAAARRGT
jgi:enoyl-CoA hydratase